MADREYYKGLIDDAMRKVLSPEHHEQLRASYSAARSTHGGAESGRLPRRTTPPRVVASTSATVDLKGNKKPLGTPREEEAGGVGAQQHQPGSRTAASLAQQQQEQFPMLEIPDHGPAEVYPDDPELEVEYIQQRFHKMYTRIGAHVWAEQKRVDKPIAEHFDHMNIHSQLLWREVIHAQDPVARMKGICRFIIVFSAGLFKPDISSGKKLDVLPMGEHVMQRKDMAGAPGISLYLQEQTTYTRPVETPEQFATGKVYGSLVLPLKPTAKLEGPFVTIDFTKNENCTLRIMKEPRVLPQSKPGYDDDYGVLSGLYPEDGNQEDEVYTFNLPSLRLGSMSSLNQGIAASELVGACQIQCEQTRMEAELRFLPQIMMGIRGRCVVDGVVRPRAEQDKTDIHQEDTAVDEPEHESQKESKSLWTKASHKMLKLTGLRKRTDSTNLEVEDIWPAHYTQLLDPPAVLSILGHWDRKVLARDERSGEVAVLHNDPLVMRADCEPILDAPLNSALRLPGSMIMRRLWSAIVDALDIQTWPEPLNSVLKTQMLAQRQNHVKQKREEAGVPLAYQLTYMFADHPTVGKLIRLPTKSRAQKDADLKAAKEAAERNAQKAAASKALAEEAQPTSPTSPTISLEQALPNGAEHSAPGVPSNGAPAADPA